MSQENNYNELINEIPADLNSFFNEAVQPQDSRETSKFKESKELVRLFWEKEQDTFFDFDKSFKRFLENFVDNQNEKEKQKRCFKKCFFYPVILVFIALMSAPLIAIFVFRNVFTEVGAIVSILTILVELTTAIIIIPKIIVTYLFNRQEDEKVLDIIQSIQEYNQKKHEYITGFPFHEEEQ